LEPGKQADLIVLSQDIFSVATLCFGASKPVDFSPAWYHAGAHTPSVARRRG
jgi:hypothetical protein